MTPDNLTDFVAVRQWLMAYASHWKSNSAEAEQRRKLQLLHQYCEFAQRDPDALISNLLRETATGKQIRLKRRRIEMQRIEEFETQIGGGEPRAGRDAGNTIRSFFIHNGVALTATPLR
jgi:hypothetical protein